MEKTFDVEIITPDRVFYKGTADLLEFNTESGEIGVYRDHIPLTTVLEPGLVTIHHGDEEQVAAVHAGFAEILGDKVTLLADWQNGRKRLIWSVRKPQESGQRSGFTTEMTIWISSARNLHCIRL